MALELHQFPYSHFNEKVRWALAYKGLEHRRINYLPGPHMPAIRKLSGQTQTPVLRIDGEPLAGSAQIIERLEQIAPDPALYPAEPKARAEALQLQNRLDAELGPNIRRALFSVMVDEGAYTCRMFSEGKSLAVRLAYRASYPLAKGLIKKGNGVTDQASIDRAYELTAAIFDDIAERVADTGYLVGENFSIADLTAAALMAPAVNPGDCEMTRPEPMPESIRRFLARWADHPGSAWVRAIYAKHR